jgi:hypothetical protein
MITRKSFAAFAHLTVTLLFLASLATNSAAAQEQVIHRFSGSPNDGNFPIGDLIGDKEGNLYGVAYAGGTFSAGMVFEFLRPAANAAWTENVLYNFPGGAGGANPLGGLVFDGKGNLFGTTYNGGAGSFPGGVAYELSPPVGGGGSWTETVLFDFSTSSSAVGLNPQGTLVMDSAGNLFGAAAAGGAGMASFCGDTGCGSIFELQPPSSPGGQWSLLDIHDFLAKSPDGVTPNSVTLGPGGALYGTTVSGGVGGLNGGIVFRLIPSTSGGQWTETFLYSFGGTSNDGDLPNGVTLEKSGGLFGTTQRGGQGSSPGNGTIFQLTPLSGGGWNESVLYDFTGADDGASPQGGVIFDSVGNLYGTARAGGSSPCTGNGGGGCGTVFRLSPPTETGGNWTETTVYDFLGGTDGDGPQGNLWLEKGILYGATAAGGSATNGGSGTIFRAAP